MRRRRERVNTNGAIANIRKGAMRKPTSQLSDVKSTDNFLARASAGEKQIQSRAFRISAYFGQGVLGNAQVDCAESF